MILDAPTFKLNLTPEAALSIIQSEINRRAYKQWEVEEIRLIYVPYYIFSFDVSAEGTAQPTGKAGLNANTGELDEFTPSILERPLNKIKATDSSSESEVEPTNIPRNDVDRVASVKIASSVGLKKDNITISAISKYYFPFYRIWINVGGDSGNSYTVNVDAILGAPLGVEGISPRKRGFEEDATIVISKLNTPSGWVELFGTLPKLISGGSGPLKEALSSKTSRWVILAAVIVLLLLLTFRGSSVSNNCSADTGFVGQKGFLGLSPAPIIPKVASDGKRYVDVTCSFVDNGNAASSACSTATLQINGVPTSIINSTCVYMQTPSTPYYGKITLAWYLNETPQATASSTYGIAYH